MIYNSLLDFISQAPPPRDIYFKLYLISGILRRHQPGRCVHRATKPKRRQVYPPPVGIPTLAFEYEDKVHQQPGKPFVLLKTAIGIIWRSGAWVRTKLVTATYQKACTDIELYLVVSSDASSCHSGQICRAVSSGRRTPQECRLSFHARL